MSSRSEVVQAFEEFADHHDIPIEKASLFWVCYFLYEYSLRYPYDLTETHKILKRQYKAAMCVELPSALARSYLPHTLPDLIKNHGDNPAHLLQLTTCLDPQKIRDRNFSVIRSEFGGGFLKTEGRSIPVSQRVVEAAECVLSHKNTYDFLSIKLVNAAMLHHLQSLGVPEINTASLFGTWDAKKVDVCRGRVYLFNIKLD
jgi:hypothetical protein